MDNKLKTHLLFLISRAKHNEAIELLLLATANFDDTSLLLRVAQQSSRLYHLNADRQNGTIDYKEKTIERSKISQSLIEIIQDLPNHAKLPQIKEDTEASEQEDLTSKSEENTNGKNLSPVQAFLADEIISLIEELNQKKVKPTVHGIDLLAFEDNSIALFNFLKKHSVIQSLDDLRRILYWKYNIQNGGLPLSGISSQEAESLYQAIFDQGRLKNNLESQNRKLDIVIFRRGRHLRDLTNLLRTLPFINVKIIVSATDDGESWYGPSRTFLAPGLPGAAKALLDLCQDRIIRDFLKHRLSKNQSDNFKRLLERLKSPGPSSSPLNDDTRKLWLKGMRIPRKDRLEIVKFLESAYSGFSFANKVGWSQKELSFEGLPLRSLLLLGAGLNRSSLKQIEKADLKQIRWQEAIEDLYEILKIRDPGEATSSEVILPSKRPQHLIAISKDGTIYFSEAAINYHRSRSPLLGLWLLDQAVDDNFIEEFKTKSAKADLVIAPKISQVKDFDDTNWSFDLSNPNKIDSVKQEVIDTTFTVLGKEDDGNDLDPAVEVAKIFSGISNSGTDANEENFGKVISPLAKESLENADIVLFSCKNLETNIGGALIVEGMGQAINSSSALKICLPDLKKANRDNATTILIDQLDRVHRYLSGQFLYKDLIDAEYSSLSSWNQVYCDYVLAELILWNKDLIYELTKVTEGEIPKNLDLLHEKQQNSTVFFWQNKRKISFIGLDIRQSHEFGLHSSTMLVESLLALFEIHNAGLKQADRRNNSTPMFKVADQGRLVQGAFIDDLENWDQSPLGLFRDLSGNPLSSQVANLIKELTNTNKVDDIRNNGGFIFDVDMTILPTGSSAQLDRYRYLAYLFTRLLRLGIPIAIISGNSEQKQMQRIYRAVQIEMKDDPSAFSLLTFYVNGGATKIKFTEEGRKYYDKDYEWRNFSLSKTVVSTIEKVLVDAANDPMPFGLNGSSEIKQYQELIADKVPGYNFKHTSLSKPGKWKPDWYTEDEIEWIRESGDPIAYPWVEMRGWSCDSGGKNEKVASLAIRPLPDILLEKADGTSQLISPRAYLIKMLKEALSKVAVNLKYIGAAGRSTIDLAVGKTTAIIDFMGLKGKLHQEHFYYFGDEFYSITIDGFNYQKGNDQEIATHEKLEITTIAVNHKVPKAGSIKGPTGKTIWIGRTPQALIEFLEAILLIIEN